PFPSHASGSVDIAGRNGARRPGPRNRPKDRGLPCRGLRLAGQEIRVSVVLARVDDRLIHGQVVVGWARHCQADCIIVANDAVSADPMQRTLLPMAVPQGIEVAIYRLKEAADRLSGGAHAAKRAILLFASPADALGFTRLG